jgi:hypothetical protein
LGSGSPRPSAKKANSASCRRQQPQAGLRKIRKVTTNMAAKIHSAKSGRRGQDREQDERREADNKIHAY